LRTSFKKEDVHVGSPVVAESTSEDSYSNEDEDSPHGSCSKLLKLLKTSEGFYKLSEFDCRVGLNAAHLHANYPCLLDTQHNRFFVWMGDVPIDKFNKSTFMNLANYAEKNGATSMILVQSRNHVQKNEFRKLFKVLDAKRVMKKGMKEMMTEERITDWI